MSKETDVQEPEAPVEAALNSLCKVQVKDDDVSACCYANFCRVTARQKIDRRLRPQPQPVGMPKDPIHVKQRVVMKLLHCQAFAGRSANVRSTTRSSFRRARTDIQKGLRVQQPS